MGRSLALCALFWMLAACNTFDDPSDGGSSGFFGDDVVPVAPPQPLPPTSSRPPGFIDPLPRAGSGGASGGWTKLDGGAIDAADGGATDDADAGE